MFTKSQRSSQTSAVPSPAWKAFKSYFVGWRYSRYQKPDRMTNLIINIDTIEVVLLYPCCHCIRSIDRICACRGGNIGGPEDRHDQLDTCSGVLMFQGMPLRVRQSCPFISLSFELHVYSFFMLSQGDEVLPCPKRLLEEERTRRFFLK